MSQPVQHQHATVFDREGNPVPPERWAELAREYQADGHSERCVAQLFARLAEIARQQQAR